MQNRNADRRPPAAPNVDENLISSVHMMTPQVRLIDTRDPDGKPVIITRDEAMRVRNDSGLDLYAVNKDSSPMVIKLLNYDKFKYEKQKQDREAAKKQREIGRPIKEFQFNAMIGDHDFDVKVKHIREVIGDREVRVFVKLNHVNKVALTNRFKKPIHVAAREEDFVLNRVVRVLGPTVKIVSTDIGEKVIVFGLKKAGK